MSNQGHPMRKPSERRPASPAVRQTKRTPNLAASMPDRKTALDRRPASSPPDVRGGRSALAQVLRHMRSGKLSEGVSYANELIRKHPLQAVLIGMGLQFIFSRTRRSKHDTGHRSILG